MEDLTKHQLILLVLLITFVTSIATGIITFTLLQEAPVEVTQTINRVVEKTIETVVTEPGKPEKVVETVVINEEDRVLDSISKNEKSIVRLKTTGADGSEVVTGMGVVVSSDGTVMAQEKSYSSLSAFSIVFFDGKSLSIRKVHIDSKNGLVFLKPDVPINEKYAFYPATLGDSNLLKIGQTVVALSGKDSNAVSIGRIKQLSIDSSKSLENIITDIAFTKNFPGSPIISLSGEVVGIESPTSSAETFTYIPINSFKPAIQEGIKNLSN